VAPLVSVAVVVKDRRERMLRCLDALLAQTHPDYEVLVIDNGSLDGTAEACAERGRGSDTPVRVEVIDGTIGRLRNAAAQLAEGELIAFTDSDCMPTPGWLEAAARAFDDERVGVVTGMTLPEQPPPYERWAVSQEVTEQTWRFEACNVFFRREPLLSAGGFAELNWGEDTTAGWAMLRAGWQARFVPEALVLHDITYPGRAWYIRRASQYGEAAAVFKRFPEARHRILWGRYFLRKRDAAYVLALLGAALTGRTRAAWLMTLPYLYMGVPHRLQLNAAHDFAEGLALDSSILAGAIRSSIRWRTLVL